MPIPAPHAGTVNDAGTPDRGDAARTSIVVQWLAIAALIIVVLGVLRQMASLREALRDGGARFTASDLPFQDA